MAKEIEQTRKRKPTPPDVVILPAIVDQEVTYRPHSSSAVVNEIIKSDLETTNCVLEALKQAWRRPMCIDDVCKMAMTTMRVLKDKRELLNQPLGAPRIIDTGRRTLRAFDD